MQNTPSSGSSISVLAEVTLY